MGQCYFVRLKLKLKDKDGAAKALRKKIGRAKEEYTNYSLDHYKKIGIGMESLEDLLKIFFGGWEGKLVQDEKNPDTLTAGFDARYGWEGVMMSAFDELSPFLEDKSSVTIYPDSGMDKAIIKNGKSIWL